MGEEKDCYVVYRVYRGKELPDTNKTSHIYGWTCSKKVLKAFLKQRGEKKYLLKKMTMDELSNRLHDHDHDVAGRYMIDFIKLKSAKTGEEFHLFMTVHEMNQAERAIQRLFEDACDLDKIDPDDISRYVNMVINLQEKYYDALFYLGYRPKEIEGLFSDDFITTSSYPYDGIPFDEYYMNDDPPVYSPTADVANKIIYSIESFVKVMREDL